MDQETQTEKFSFQDEQESLKENSPEPKPESVQEQRTSIANPVDISFNDRSSAHSKVKGKTNLFLSKCD